MRPYKSSKDLPVTNPHLTYQELLDKHLRRAGINKPTTGPGSPAGILSFLLGPKQPSAQFTRGELERIEAREDFVEKMLERAIESSEKKLAETPSPHSAGEVVPNIEATPQTETTSEAPNISVAAQANLETPPTPPPSELVQLEISEPMLVPPNQLAEPKPAEPAVLNAQPPSSQLPEIVKPEPRALAATIDSAAPLTAMAPPPPPASPTDRTSQLFAEAYTSLLTEDQPIVLEIGITDLNQRVNGDLVNVFFDLAAQEIEDPAILKRLASDVATSETKRVEATSLNVQLLKVERELNKPLPSLAELKASGGPAADSELHSQTHSPHLKEIDLITRLSCFLLDLAMIALLSAVGSFLIIDFALPQALSDISIGEPSYSFTPWLFLQYWAPLFLATLVLYPLLALTAFRRTIGTSAFRIRLYSSDRKHPRMISIITRSLLWPSSLLLGGTLPAILGYRPIHDVLAKTTLLQRELAKE